MKDERAHGEVVRGAVSAPRLAMVSRPKRIPIIRIWIYYVVFLILTLLSAGYLIGKNRIFDEAREVLPYAKTLSALSAQAPTSGTKTIIYFGDSNSFYPPNAYPVAENFDIYMPGLLRKAVIARQPDLQIKVIDFSFEGADMFSFYCFFFAALDLSPDLIIVPVNWRSFGTRWIDDLNYFFPELSALVPLNEGLPAEYRSPIRSRGISFMKQVQYKARLYNNYPLGIKLWILDQLRGSSKDTGEKETVRFLKDPLEYFSKSRGEQRGWESIYPSKITEANVNFQCMRALAYIASRKNVDVLFYFWPLNLQRTGELFNIPEFERSKSLIRERTVRDHIHLLDLTDRLSPEDFHDFGMHCTINGRTKIAQILAPKVLEILARNGAPANTLAGTLPRNTLK